MLKMLMMMIIPMCVARLTVLYYRKPLCKFATDYFYRDTVCFIKSAYQYGKMVVFPFYTIL